MFKWDALTSEIQAALTLIGIAAAAWLISKVVKGDVSAAAKILGSAIIALIALGVVFIMTTPETAKTIVDNFVG